MGKTSNAKGLTRTSSEVLSRIRKVTREHEDKALLVATEQKLTELEKADAASTRCSEGEMLSRLQGRPSPNMRELLKNFFRVSQDLEVFRRPGVKSRVKPSTASKHRRHDGFQREGAGLLRRERLNRRGRQRAKPTATHGLSPEQYETEWGGSAAGQHPTTVESRVPR